MGIGAAESKCTDTGNPGLFSAEPGRTGCRQLQREFIPGDEGVRLLQVEMRRYFFMLESQRYLDQAGYSRGGFQMPYVGLHRADFDWAVFRAINPQCGSQRPGFNRVSQRCARA